MPSPSHSQLWYSPSLSLGNRGVWNCHPPGQPSSLCSVPRTAHVSPWTEPRNRQGGEGNRVRPARQRKFSPCGRNPRISPSTSPCNMTLGALHQRLFPGTFTPQGLILHPLQSGPMPACLPERGLQAQSPDTHGDIGDPPLEEGTRMQSGSSSSSQVTWNVGTDSTC